MEGPDRPLFPEGVPMGLGMAMLQYPGAMEKYGALEEEAQRQLIDCLLYTSPSPRDS